MFRYKISRGKCHISYIEVIYNEFKDLGRSNEEVLLEKSMVTPIQILYDKGLFDIYEKADEILNVVFSY